MQVFLNGDWINGVNVTLSSEECVGTMALSEIIAAKAGYNGNCSLYTFYGRRIRTCEQAMIRTSETGKMVMNDLFIVPEGRFFMLPAREIGEVMYMNHIGESIYLTFQTFFYHSRLSYLLSFIAPFAQLTKTRL